MCQLSRQNVDFKKKFGEDTNKPNNDKDCAGIVDEKAQSMAIIKELVATEI